MDWLKLILEFIKKVFGPLMVYKAGRNSKENEQLRSDNEILKKFDDIENGEHSSNDIYTHGMWK